MSIPKFNFFIIFYENFYFEIYVRNMHENSFFIIVKLDFMKFVIYNNKISIFYNKQ